MSESIGLWIGAFLTLGIFSFLYKDNPLYKFCEALFVGISAGYWLVTSYWQIIVAKMVDPLQVGFDYIMVLGWFDLEKWLPLLGAVFGILMLMRLFPGIGWISRWSLAFVVGTTAGLYFIVYLVSNGMIQVSNTIQPLLVPGNLDKTIGNMVVTLGTLCGLIYFFFSKEHKGVFGGAARVGIWFIMITFGASFGYTVMSRMSLLIGRMDYLIISFGKFFNLFK